MLSNRGFIFLRICEILCLKLNVIMFPFRDSKQPQNPRKFEPLEINYPYGAVDLMVILKG